MVSFHPLLIFHAAASQMDFPFPLSKQNYTEEDETAGACSTQRQDENCINGVSHEIQRNDASLKTQA
jgi:hypothetical protein